MCYVLIVTRQVFSVSYWFLSLPFFFAFSSRLVTRLVSFGVFFSGSGVPESIEPEFSLREPLRQRRAATHRFGTIRHVCVFQLVRAFGVCPVETPAFGRRKNQRRKPMEGPWKPIEIGWLNMEGTETNGKTNSKPSAKGLPSWQRGNWSLGQRSVPPLRAAQIPQM